MSSTIRRLQDMFGDCYPSPVVTSFKEIDNNVIEYVSKLFHKNWSITDPRYEFKKKSNNSFAIHRFSETYTIKVVKVSEEVARCGFILNYNQVTMKGKTRSVSFYSPNALFIYLKNLPEPVLVTSEPLGSHPKPITFGLKDPGAIVSKSTATKIELEAPIPNRSVLDFIAFCKQEWSFAT